MRPVERGNVPLDKDGNPKLYKKYDDARDDLIACLGDYCSYCEMKIPTPAVEHIQPKSLANSLKLSWSNFLLACPSCNSVKKDKPIDANNLGSYFWVDADNTFRIFRYEKDLAPQIALHLNIFQRKIAQNTLELTGLDREPTHPKLSKKDVRWKERNEAWGKAERAKINLQKNNTDAMREQIIDTATSTGFFSVWMTVFEDDKDIRHCLIKAFRGTSQNCFDQNAKPISRPNGQI